MSYHNRFLTLEERFWQKVDTSEGPLSCWEWDAYRNKRGYGVFRFHDTTMGAHRASWIIHHGEVPSSRFVRHRCDNPPCVNPRHLELGTHADNMQDMVERGLSDPCGHNRSTTHCPQDHEYTPENTRVYKHPTKGWLMRYCKTCHREREARRRAARKVAA